MIKIQLKNEATAFRPGDEISGTVTWDELTRPPKKIETRLIWYTSGKGDRDFDTVATRTVESPQKTATASFHFVAPQRPYSFSGTLISLQWAIEVIAFPHRESARVDLTLSPTGNEILLSPVEEKETEA